MRFGVLNVFQANEDGPKVPKGCVDLDVNCNYWATAGSCKSQASFMKARCPCICHGFRERECSTSLTTTAAPTTARPETTSLTTTAAPETTVLTTSAAPETTVLMTTAAPETTSLTTTAAPETTSLTTTAAPETTSLTTTAAPETTSLTTNAAPTSLTTTAMPQTTVAANDESPPSPAPAPVASTTTPVAAKQPQQHQHHQNHRQHHWHHHQQHRHHHHHHHQLQQHARAGSVIRADTSACPAWDRCGLASSRGCTSCPEGQGWINDGCACRQPLAALEEGPAEAWGEEVPPGLESAAEGDLPYFLRSDEESPEATEAATPH